jgi:hypothetical protein
LDWIDLAQDRAVEGSYEHGNERSGSIKCWDYFLSGCGNGSFSSRAQLHEWVNMFGNHRFQTSTAVHYWCWICYLVFAPYESGQILWCFTGIYCHCLQGEISRIYVNVYINAQIHTEQISNNRNNSIPHTIIWTSNIILQFWIGNWIYWPLTECSYT